MRMILLVASLAAVALLVWWCMRKKKDNKEGYANIGDISNVGSLNDGYDLVAAPEDDVPGEHFADLVDCGDHPGLDPKSELKYIRPMERLHRVQGSQLMPRISKDVTPYNVDIADPVTHSYMVNPPRVQLKDPIKMLADPYRGDIPIKYYPNISLVAKSQYGRDSLRLDGFFSSQYRCLYNKYTGKGYKNMPLKVVNEEILMDY